MDRARFFAGDVLGAVFFCRAPTFFAGALEHNFDSPDDLLAYLARMARNKVCDAGVRNVQAQKRDIQREQSLHADNAAPQPDRGQATPSQYIMADEEWERMLTESPEHLRPILLLLRKGHTHAEIGEVLGCTEEAARKHVARGRAKLTTLRAGR